MKDMESIIKAAQEAAQNIQKQMEESQGKLETIEVEGVRILLVHDRDAVQGDPAAAGVDVVVSGHSHRPLVERRGGVLYFNPGSAGQRRFRLPVCVGRLVVDGSTVRAEVVELPI